MNDDANPYAPPAPEEERDSDIVLARNEAYRVAGNKLYCRRGMERFPGICWLTGSTERLVGVHSKKGRYLPKRAFRLSVVAAVLWMIALMRMNAPLTIFYPSLFAMWIGDYVISWVFGKPFQFVIGETELGRTNRRRSGWFMRSWTLVGLFSIGTVLSSADNVMSWSVAVLLGIIAATLAIAFLSLRPRPFKALVREHSDNVLVVRGLTKEFLESLQRKDAFQS